MAYSEHMRNNLDGARDLYEKAIATQQASAEVFNNYGVLLEQRGNRAGATAMYQQAVNRDNTNVEAWVNLGDSFNSTGHHAEALSAYARAIQLDPSRAAVKTRLAAEYEAIGDSASARRLYEDAIKTQPNDARAHHAYGTFLYGRRDYRGALREFELVVQLAESESGQVQPEKIVELKRYIVSLRRAVP